MTSLLVFVLFGTGCGKDATGYYKGKYLSWRALMYEDRKPMANEIKRDMLNKSLEEFRQVYTNFPQSQYGQKALYETGRIYLESLAFIDDELNENDAKNGCYYFQLLVEKYPKGELADIAQFKIGEGYVIVRDYAGARKEFEKLIKQYPASKLCPDALFWTGVTYRSERKYGEAIDIFKRVVKFYPQSEVSDDALYNVGLCSEYSYDWVSAKKAYSEYIRRFPRGRYNHNKFPILSPRDIIRNINLDSDSDGFNDEWELNVQTDTNSRFSHP